MSERTIVEGDGHSFRMEGCDIIREDESCAGYSALDFQEHYIGLADRIAGLETALAAKEQENAELRTQMAALLRVDDPHTVLTSLEVLLKDADARAIAAEARAKGLAAALEQIKREGGKVCEEFELCTHEACRSSVAAYFIADAALDANRTQAPESVE